jgi:hypothetical protein
MMLSTSIIFTLFLLIINTSSVQSGSTDRTYIIKKDRIMSDFRLAEFSIYYPTKSQRKYRIRTHYTDHHASILYAYPSGQIMGMLEGEWSKEIPRANISILNDYSNQWIDASIEQIWRKNDKHYAVVWNGTKIIIQGKFLSSSKKMYDEVEGKVLAEFRPSSGLFVSPPTSYKLTVMSKKVPDTVYFFAVAVMDHKLMIDAL